MDTHAKQSVSGRLASQMARLTGRTVAVNNRLHWLIERWYAKLDTSVEREKERKAKLAPAFMLRIFSQVARVSLERSEGRPPGTRQAENDEPR